MAIFQWKARTRQGALKKGEIEAVNEAAVMAQLRAQMLLPVTVKEKAKDVSEYLPFLQGRDHDPRPGHLHAAVRDDDRRGSSARPVPGDPLGSAAEQDLQEASSAT